jgi:hypothetical protein
VSRFRLAEKDFPHYKTSLINYSHCHSSEFF